MNIEKSYTRGYIDEKLHLKVVFRVKDEKSDVRYVFAVINEEKSFNFYDLLNEQYLKENNIEYIIEKENNKDRIIPIGLVKFNNNIEIDDLEFGLDRKYMNHSLSLLTDLDDDRLHLCNGVIENIEKAIEIKYEACKFSNKFKRNGSDRIIETKKLL